MEPGFYIDLANLQWWQGLVGIIGVLGLSPAPWILGLATGRIQFTAQADRAHDARVADLKDSHAQALKSALEHYDELTAEKDAHHTATRDSRNYYRDAYNRVDEANGELLRQNAELGMEAARIAARFIGTTDEQGSSA